jgi:hypothetical protein
VQVTGVKVKNYMSKKIQYTDEPMGEVKLIEDFLPPPEQLVLKNQQQNSIISKHIDNLLFKLSSFKEELHRLGFTNSDFELFEKESSSIKKFENNQTYKNTSNVIPFPTSPTKEKENVKRRQTR